MPRDWKQNNLGLLKFEAGILPKKYKIVAGVDEAGRGPLAGPVVAGAVILKQSSFKNRIFDSKQLSTFARQAAYKEIIKKAYIGVGIVNRKIIDEKNILQATIIAIKKAVDNLGISPEYLLVDGRFKQRSWAYPYQTVIKGDQLCLSIACASIVAKVVRDNLMTHYARFYPQYGFECNRGYLTPQHLKAIKRYGLTPIHRRSFRPIHKNIIAVKKLKKL